MAGSEVGQKTRRGQGVARARLGRTSGRIKDSSGILPRESRSGQKVYVHDKALAERSKGGYGRVTARTGVPRHCTGIAYRST